MSDLSEFFDRVKLKERSEELASQQQSEALKLKIENDRMVFESKEYELIRTSCL